ncbi:hypothetical protein L9F63_004207, partial [Diploptera punctata]
MNQNNSKYEGYWGVVSKAVEHILQGTPGTRVSFEQMYSIVYKSVCDGFSEKMHDDLMAQCTRHLELVDLSLNSYKQESDQQQGGDVTRLIIFFHQALECYLKAIQQITPIFAYMNKFYVEVTSQSSLHAQLLDLFRHKVADNRMDVLMASVEDLLTRPFALPPAAISALFVNLHCVGRGEYGRRYPHLFSRYVPGILPPMKEGDLDAHIAEIRALQDNLRAEDEGATAMQKGQKRRGDDENYGPTFCVALSNQQQASVLPDIMFNN